jgi:hypothetical protein
LIESELPAIIHQKLIDRLPECPLMGTIRTFRDVRVEYGFGGIAEVPFEGREDCFSPEDDERREGFLGGYILSGLLTI